MARMQKAERIPRNWMARLKPEGFDIREQTQPASSSAAAARETANSAHPVGKAALYSVLRGSRRAVHKKNSVISTLKIPSAQVLVLPEITSPELSYAVRSCQRRRTKPAAAPASITKKNGRRFVFALMDLPPVFCSVLPAAEIKWLHRNHDTGTAQPE